MTNVQVTDWWQLLADHRTIQDKKGLVRLVNIFIITDKSCNHQYGLLDQFLKKTPANNYNFGTMTTLLKRIST